MTNTMMQTYKNITKIDNDSNHVIKDKEFIVLETCKNDYHVEQLEFIPAGTTIIGDFAGDFGCYAMAEIEGVIHRVKIEVNELHKINWGPLDARKF